MLTESKGIESWVDHNGYIQVGLEYNRSRYLSAGHDNVYIPDTNNYKIFGDYYRFKYYRNILPYDRTTDWKILDFKLHPASLSQSYLILISGIGVTKLFGFEVTSEVQCAIYDCVNKTLICDAEIKHSGSVNLEQLIWVEGTKTVSLNNFIYIGNGLTYQTFYPEREKLISPFSLTVQYTWLESYLEKYTEYKLELPMKQSTLQNTTIKTVTMKYPKILIWYAGKYFTLDDTGSLIQFTPPSGELTLDDVDQYGIRFERVNTIDKDTWITVRSSSNQTDKLMIISNGYLFPILIDTTYLLSKYDTSKFIWNKKKKNAVLPIVGDI